MTERAEITVIGPVDGIGQFDIRGSYVALAVCLDGKTERIRVSVGQAQVMAEALNGLLLDRPLGAFTIKRHGTIPDIDRFVGGIIDAYEFAPNGEDEKREAVRECVERSGWRP